MLLIIAQVLVLLLLLAGMSGVAIGGGFLFATMTGMAVNYAIILAVMGGVSAVILLIYVLSLIHAQREAKKLKDNIADIFISDEFFDKFK